MLPVEELLVRQGQLEAEVSALKLNMAQVLHRLRVLESNEKIKDQPSVPVVSTVDDLVMCSGDSVLRDHSVVGVVKSASHPPARDIGSHNSAPNAGGDGNVKTETQAPHVPSGDQEGRPQTTGEAVIHHNSEVLIKGQLDVVHPTTHSPAETTNPDAAVVYSQANIPVELGNPTSDTALVPEGSDCDSAENQVIGAEACQNDASNQDDTTIPAGEKPVESTTISEPSQIKSLPVRPVGKQELVDICLQTDLEEDPEIYYFAGGRHVGSQTDCDSEYEPLIPFEANTKLEIVVLNSSPPGDCVSSTIWEQQDSADAAQNIVALPPVETEKKVDETLPSPKTEKDEWKTVTTRSNRTKWSQSSSSLGSSAANSSRGSLDRSSIGDYRDRGLTGSTGSRGRLLTSVSNQLSRGSPNRFQNSSSSSSSNNNNNNNVNRPRNQPWRGTGRGSMSNTSSAANFLKSRFYQPSSTISLPVLNDTKDDTDHRRSSHPLKQRGEGYGSRDQLCRKKISLAANLDICPTENSNKPKLQKPASQQRSTQTSKKPLVMAGSTSVGSQCKADVGSGSSRRPASSSSSSAPPTVAKPRGPVSSGRLLSLSARPTSSRGDKEKSVLDKSGIAKKKIESSGTTSTSNALSSGRGTKTQSLRTNVPQSPTVAAAQLARKSLMSSTSAKSNVKSSAVPISSPAPKKMKESKTKEVLMMPKARPVVDVVEIVQLTSSSSSSSHNNSNNGAGEKWREQDNESSNDDEEIQLKEAALESAIMESELLAEELLQVEKDFEEIESRAADSVSVDEGSNVSECGETRSSPSTFPESETEAEINDFCSDLDQFFFIAINENSILSGDDNNLEERIVAKKEKLRLSPAKKCDSEETLKRHRAKLAKAERNRERLLQAKYNRYVELSERFASLNETTKRLVEERYDLMAKADQRRKRAAEKRELYLKNIVKKAHDEDSKAKEIAFINLLEAQNKRHDYLANVQEVEDRLNSIQEERNLKFQDRASKVQAVIERQENIRQNWETKLAAMQEKRRKINERITREREERAKERSELAQEKARDREERLSALNAAKLAEKAELQKKIQQKQEETARRHEENIEQIRQKAIELTLPRTSEDPIIPTVRMCSLCKVTMQSEVQELAHLRSRAHLDAVRRMEQENAGSKIENFGLKFITDVQVDKIGVGVRHDKNRSKKHCKKLMLKLVSNGEQFEQMEKDLRVDKPWGDPTLKAKVVKNLKELERSIGCFCGGKGSLSLANSMDKLLTDVRRTINKNKSVQDAAVSLRAFSVVSKILQCSASDLPPKILIGACNLIVGATYQHLTNGIYVLRSTVICSLIDLVVSRLNNLIPDGNRWLAGSPGGSNDSLQADSVADFAIETLFTLLSIVPDPYDGISSQKETRLKECEIQEITYRTQDIIAYLVSANVIDRLSVYCSGVQGPVDNQPGVANLLKISLDFLTALVWCLTFCLERRSNNSNGMVGKRESDPTQLLATLESSELAGSISMSYALLLYQGAPIRPRLIKTDQGLNGEDMMTAASTTATVILAPSPPPPAPGSRTASVVKSTLCLVNAVARLDIMTLQNILGSEAVSLQFRHIASQLLWQVVPHREDRAMWGLLQELFIAIGHFTVKNLHNQMTIQSGQTPTVLQQLCAVAKEFLSDLRLSRSILPTLIAATHGCPENRDLLIQESFPIDLLDGFLESKFSHANMILRRLVVVSPSPHNNNSNNNNNNNNNHKDPITVSNK